PAPRYDQQVRQGFQKGPGDPGVADDPAGSAIEKAHQFVMLKVAVAFPWRWFADRHVAAAPGEQRSRRIVEETLGDDHPSRGGTHRQSLGLNLECGGVSRRRPGASNAEPA